MEAEYAKEKDLLVRFFLEHTILVYNSHSSILSGDDDTIDDETMLEPTAHGDVRLVTCYSDLLQRINDRNFYSEDDDRDLNSSTKHANVASRVFIVEIPLDELESWNEVTGGDLAKRIESNTMRYYELCCAAIDEILEGLPNMTNPHDEDQPTIRDTIDILHEHRLANHQDTPANNTNGTQDDATGNLNHFVNESNIQQEANNAGLPLGVTEAFPPQLMRRYEIRILPRNRRGRFRPFAQQYFSTPYAPTQELPIRHIRSQSLGKIVTVRGMIVRCSDVKPSCVVATYACDVCGAELYQVVQHKREFMPPRICPSSLCEKRAKSKRETLHLQIRGSKFMKFQECKLQELPSQVPMGHVPRSLTIICRGELTRIVSPGDVVTIDGVFLPQRLAESGYKAMKGGLVTTTFLEAQNIVVHKKSFDESQREGLSPEMLLELQSAIEDVATSEDPIGKLASSIAPEIFGNDDIKRALLLQLVGGCTRNLPDGMRIRGDINICLMGDPGIAKSQLLKYIASITPRGVYTTGKGSSGVGLTAAITKDLTTGELALEGGALVLADQGICCIDEFDKMDEADRTAIHEVMEQQTVSIAKAGIVATLNARAAVLAAANPLFGRYNLKKSLSENINLPNSLLSRFDLLFLVLDHADVDRDIALARHVTSVHQKEVSGTVTDDEDDDNERIEKVVDGDLVEPHILREYIVRARQYRPYISPDVAPYIVEAYVALRNSNGASRSRNRVQSDQTALTARQLLSILRLSQALARLRFSNNVAREDVDEAIRITHMSKASLEYDSSIKNGSGSRREDVASKIFSAIRDYSTSTGKKDLELSTVESIILRKGFTLQQLHYCLEEYESLQIIQINQSKTRLYFVTENSGVE